MSSKKILIFSLAYYPNHVGGAEAAIREITDRIDPDEIEFHMICLRFDSNLPKTERIGNVLIHRIGFTKSNPSLPELKKFPLHLNKFIFQLYSPFVALKLHKKHKYGAIWAMMAHSAGVPAAIFKILKPKIPYILTLQEGTPIKKIEKTMKPLWPLFTRAFTSADIIQAISRYLAEWPREMGYRGTIELIHNGGNPADFAANFTEQELEGCRQKINKQKGDIFLVTASRLVEKNATDDTIRALEYLPKNIKFLVIGGGPDEEKLRNLAEKLKVEDRVVFLGQIPRTEVSKYRKVSDIFIRPSRSEGFGNAFISAMAAKLPVIATQEGGITEFLFDAKRNPDKETTGWAVDKDSPKQIAQAVKDILDNPKQTEKVVTTAHKMACKKYNWDSVARDIKTKVFEKVLELK